MLSTVSPTSITRSSLEEMLETLRRHDDKPKDVPPALPARPTSRARLPSVRRSLPISFKIGMQQSECLSYDTRREEEEKELNHTGKESDFEGETLGSNKPLNPQLPVGSPYVRMVKMECCEARSKIAEDLDSSAESSSSSSSSLSLMNGECGQEENLRYVPEKKKVWYRLPNSQWQLGITEAASGEEVTIALSDGEVVTISNENILPADPDILDGVDDLLQLSYLNEPSVLYNLQQRHACDKIYTKAGPVLVAINPFKDILPDGNDLVSAYRQKLKDDAHVYAIADSVFNQMMTDGVNQSIIISGDSGAGKTETAKIAMQYLAALGDGNGIEDEVLQTNPILEAFGNAKTLKNDNSSRFGKLIEIYFGPSGKICGAKIETFILEKSRLVQRAVGERSYHIFYQLCAGASPTLKDRLNLKGADEYEYLKRSDCLAVANVDDAQKFRKLLEALDTVQISKEDQENAFSMLAAILWLGNISFSVIDNENHVEVVADEGVINAANLMGCNVQDLIFALSTHTIRADNDSITQKLTLSQAIDTRDALAKYIYESLFDWIVQQINKAIEAEKHRTERFISILDIYGFESYEMNSFEQLCINYANERLRQYFNRHLFKLEQEEYDHDGIDWTKVDFEDNQDCLNLFEKKPLGLFSLLDEESNLPNGTDLSFVHKLKQHLNANPRFKFKGGRGGAFSVHHYAGEVLYNTNGFLEKNRDILHSDSTQLLSSCSCQLPQLFASNMYNQSKKPSNPLWRLGGADSQKQSVVMKLKGQLFKLMQRLENTTPHFICCLKPNNKKCPGLYENDLILQQLKSCGILEVVKISKSGYPTRMTHQQFVRRYGFLLLESVVSEDLLAISMAILHQFKILPDMYQVGYTKLFFRTGQIVVLEDLRNQIIKGILLVQKFFRVHQARCRFLDIKMRISTLQSFIRGESARKDFRILIQRQRAAMIIQKHVKQIINRKLFRNQKNCIVLLQSVIRALLARRQLEILQSLGRLNIELADEKEADIKFRESSHIQVLPSVLAELHRRVVKAEASLRERDDENEILQQQLKQYEKRWLEYENRMKSMEETWQRQYTSLQMSLAAAKRSLPSDDTAAQAAGRPDASPGLLHYCDSDDGMSTGSRTPDILHFNATNHTSNANGSQVTVGRLLKEFDMHKQVFEDDAAFLIEVKSRQQSVPDLNPDLELRRLKERFEIWKKEYKVRLRETKVALHKLGNSETEKSRRKWWGKRTMRT